MDDQTAALAALSESGIEHTVTRHGRVGSLTEAAAARGVEPTVIADERIVGTTISLGAGGHGVAATLAADDVVRHFGAQVADVTDPS